MQCKMPGIPCCIPCACVAVWGARYYPSRRRPAGRLTSPGPSSVLVKRHKTGSAMQNELYNMCRQPQVSQVVSQGWLLLDYVHSYTSLSHKGYYHALLASSHIGFRTLSGVPIWFGSRARVAPPSLRRQPAARSAFFEVLNSSGLAV